MAVVNSVIGRAVVGDVVSGGGSHYKPPKFYQFVAAKKMFASMPYEVVLANEDGRITAWFKMKAGSKGILFSSDHTRGTGDFMEVHTDGSVKMHHEGSKVVLTTSGKDFRDDKWHSATVAYDSSLKRSHLIVDSVQYDYSKVDVLGVRVRHLGKLGKDEEYFDGFMSFFHMFSVQGGHLWYEMNDESNSFKSEHGDPGAPIFTISAYDAANWVLLPPIPARWVYAFAGRDFVSCPTWYGSNSIDVDIEVDYEEHSIPQALFEIGGISCGIKDASTILVWADSEKASERMKPTEIAIQPLNHGRNFFGFRFHEGQKRVGFSQGGDIKYHNTEMVPQSHGGAYAIGTWYQADGFHDVIYFFRCIDRHKPEFNRYYEINSGNQYIHDSGPTFSHGLMIAYDKKRWVRVPLRGDL